jgi:ABC-type transport system involved in multi-copper enzyme maturation permease subunit
MFKTMIWKEVRENLAFPLVIAMFMGWLAISMVADFETEFMRRIDLIAPGQLKEMDDSMLTVVIAACSLLLGVTVGFWQAQGESFAGTAGFFFHLGRSRRRILGSKIAAMLILWALSILVPPTTAFTILMASHDPPMSWLDFGPVLRTSVAGLVIYLAVLAAGIRGRIGSEGFKQLAGLLVLCPAVALAYALELPLAQLVVLAATSVLALAWAWTGLAVREY